MYYRHFQHGGGARLVGTFTFYVWRIDPSHLLLHHVPPAHVEVDHDGAGVEADQDVGGDQADTVGGGGQLQPGQAHLHGEQ